MTSKYLALAVNAEGELQSAQVIQAESDDTAMELAQDLFYSIMQARHGKPPVLCSVVIIATADVASVLTDVPAGGSSVLPVDVEALTGA